MFNLPSDIESAHAFAFCAPESEHRAVALAFARKLLPSGWVEGEKNPDLFFVGEISKPATIDECREMTREISLMPVASKKRLAVIFASDRLLLPAANSLLKITEEPPAHVVLLFIMQTNNLLPTLRSRVRFVSLMPQLRAQSAKMPGSDREWLAWAEKSGEIPDMIASLEGWASEALENGDAQNGDAALAFKIENIRLVLDGGKLSKQMSCDLILLALKEGLAVEHLSGDFW